MRIKNFKLEEYFAKYEFNVEYSLCSSDCESFSVDELLTLEKESIDDLKKVWLGYTESTGNPLLREKISQIYSNINPEEVIVFSGAEEAIFVLMNVLLNKDDHLIVQYPAYQSLYEIATAIGCKVTKWLMDEEKHWELNLQFLESSITSSTKCIVVNFPHNPSGFLPTKDFYKKLINIAQEHNIYLLSDEVYKFLEYVKADRLPSACDLYDKSCSIGVMSKSYGLAGLRIGWLATRDKALYKKIASFKNYTTICNSALSEFFAILALRNRNKILKRNLEIINRNLILLDSFFNKYDKIFAWIKPRAGSIAFPRLLIGDTVEDFCLGLLKEKSVLLMPSTNYEYGNRHFRIGFGRKNMPEALQKLEEYLKEQYKEYL
ncbi:MAG: aminotransferase class I/II-fold pyridoxal phosphate-dependent enzyme [Candidatus Lokiarchaeota archaeon]|nr:aminotransferase class I/II-fold pyridoxal phosphate-dependent enzyme [Candidatus Lokiarchaeota archaeon]